MGDAMKSGWVTKKLGDVCELIGGGTPSIHVAHYYGGNIPWATVRDMNCRVISKTERTITKQGLENSASNIIPAGNVVISTHVGLGKVCFVAKDTAINQDLKGVIPLSGELNRTYLYYWFLSIANFLVSSGTGSTVRGVKLEFVKSLDIPIPPLSEQRRIVAKIDAAFEKIDALKANAEKNLANAKELFQSALDEAMRPKKGWVEKRLGEVCVILDSQRIPITKKDRKPGKIPYYGATKQVDSVSDYIFDERLLLLGEDGADWSAGANSAYIIEGKSWVNNHAHVLRPMADIVNDVWLMFYLNATDLTKWVSGTTVPKLNQKNMCEIPVPIPPIHEQTILAMSIGILSSKLETIQQNYIRQIADCAEMKQAILREAFEGRL